jgi:YVTN family beta-propeller protein
LTPNGKRLYVANARSNSVSVIDTTTDVVIKTIANVGPEPRGLAITNDGDADDADETLYVTQFLSLPVLKGVDGADNSKAGHVTVISTATNAVVSDVSIEPLEDTGFNALGDALNKIAPPAPPASGPIPETDFKFKTGAYPNQLNNIAIKGNFAFVPSTGASPNGPVRFDVNTQSLLSVINRGTTKDAGQTINMHLAVKNQTNTDKLFVTQPWAIAFANKRDEAYVVSAASNHLVKVGVNPVTGAATVQNDPSDPTRVLQISVGKNPRGIVINPTDTRAYVANFISRDVSVVDLSAPRETVVATLPSAALPAPGSQEDKILIGKELYNTSIGVFDAATPSGPAIVGRMSNKGWGSCAACHTPRGLSDNVVWIFGSGPKRTIPQHTDFDLTVAARTKQRALNWSAERDEQEDFELNIRGVSGGLGLIVQQDGVTPELTTNVANLRPAANGGRNQLKVREVNAWDAIKAYIQFGIRPPISPVPATQVEEGRALFISANCQSCHGGPQWTNSTINFTAPPNAGVVVSNDGELLGQLSSVGTFDAANRNEVKANGLPSIGASGFTPPSLLSLHAFPQTFLHNGAAGSLNQVLDNVTHRSAGTQGVDKLSVEADRDRVVQFLPSIDASTAPISPTAP